MPALRAALGARLPQPLQSPGAEELYGLEAALLNIHALVSPFSFFFFLFLRSGREGINAERAAKQRQQHLGSRVREAEEADAITSEFI